MKITTKVNIGADKLILKNIHEVEKFLLEDLNVFRKHEITSILIEYNDKHFYIYQQ